MDRRKTYGQYIVGQGRDFRIKEAKTHFGYVRELGPDTWYIVHITGKVLGAYTTSDAETMAINLAKGLDKRDQKRLADEMEKILAATEENTNS